MKAIDLSIGGGFPWLDDYFDYLQTAWTEALVALGAGGTSGPHTVSGCEVTRVLVGGTTWAYTVAPGWVWYEGSLVRVPGNTVDVDVSVDAAYMALTGSGVGTAVAYYNGSTPSSITDVTGAIVGMAIGVADTDMLFAVSEMSVGTAVVNEQIISMLDGMAAAFGAGTTTPVRMSGIARSVFGPDYEYSKGWLFYYGEYVWFGGGTYITAQYGEMTIAVVNGVPTATLSSSVGAITADATHFDISNLVDWAAAVGITAAQAAITTLEGDVTTIDADITTIEGDISTLNSEVGGLLTDMTTAEGAITTLNSEVAVGAWKNIVLGTDWGAGSLIIQSKADGMGRVALRGNLAALAGAGVTMGTLDSSAWPPYDMTFVVAYYSSGTMGFGVIDIETNGVVSLDVPGSIATDDGVYVDGIMYYKA